MLAPVLALVLVTLGGLLLLAVASRMVPRAVHARRAWLAQRRRTRAAAAAELRARAAMDELCPHGWRAQITLVEAAVQLEWTEFEDDFHQTGVARRLAAASIHEALEAMVADRRTDVTLQDIEQAALADGAAWPDD